RQAILVLQGKPTTGQPNFKNAREALIVLIHLVGDLHQPLHVGAVYLNEHGRRVDPDKTGFRRNTFTVGGNSLWVSGAKAVPVKLHASWDAVPAQLKPARVDAAWLATARSVQRDTGEPADWPVRWGTQALEQARHAFEGMKFSERQGDRWEVELPLGYEARAADIKRLQLTRAGARLAQLLQSIRP
ncbi:MAG: hypothetical protein EOP39_15310, partial [Rubrivivax sp.]